MYESREPKQRERKETEMDRRKDKASFFRVITHCGSNQSFKVLVYVDNI